MAEFTLHSFWQSGNCFKAAILLALEPLTLLPHQPSPSESMRLTITARGEEQVRLMLSSAMRGRLRNKERKLQKLLANNRVPSALNSVFTTRRPIWQSTVMSPPRPNSYRTWPYAA